MPVRCLTVDDEVPALELLRRHIGQIEDLEIVAECNSAVKAFELLKKEEIHLIFLDIQMPVLTGIDFVRALKHPPRIVLTTAYRDYAVEAYDLDIVDYLLKPISFDRFFKAVERYYQRIAPLANSGVRDVPGLQGDYLFVNINKKNHKLIFADILYVESLKDYVRIHTINARHVVKGNIGSFYKQLPKDQFIRIHRSFVVSKSRISAFGAMELELQDVCLPIGPSYREDLINAINR